VNSLTIGNVYFVRVYSWTSTAGQTSSFDICISEIGPCGTTSATEDFCPYPAILTQGVGSWSSSTAATYSADEPGNIASVFCGSIENNSWYQFTALSTVETFDITAVLNCSSGIQAQVYNVTYDATGCCTGFTSMSNCFNPATATTGTVTATGLTIGSDYILMVDGYGGDNCDFTVSNWTATGIILPVELVEFYAFGADRQNILKWKTVSEQNSDYFRVMRSFDGIHFEEIGRVESAGTSSNVINYSFIDEDVRTGTVYYQLEQLDFDGHMTPSNIISLNRTADHGGILSARPNPTDNLLLVEIKPRQMYENPVVYLMDSRGVVVRSRALNPGELNTIDFQIADLASGVYFLIYTDIDGITHSEKILKK
jgi:hypothetical protein